MKIFGSLTCLFKRQDKTLYKASKCGHETKISGEINIFGKIGTMEMPIQKDGSVIYCLDCIGKMSIKCAWCGEPIVIGDPITLYSPSDKDFKIPEHAIVYNEDPLQLAGCLRWDCADTGADRAGFWLPGENGKGQVYRVPTAYEILMNSKTKSAVIINDLHNIAEALDPEVIQRKEHEE